MPYSSKSTKPPSALSPMAPTPSASICSARYGRNCARFTTSPPALNRSMGVFGAGIFGDDDALDVRSDYKVFLADSQSDALATDAIARQYGAAFDDPAATSSFWLALAWTQ